MDRVVFNLSWAALINAFPNSKVTPESQDVYWTMLKEVPDDLFDRGVKKCLAECTFFPTIHEIGDKSIGEVWDHPSYNPHVYREPIKLSWEQGLKRIVADRQGKSLQTQQRKKFPKPGGEVDDQFAKLKDKLVAVTQERDDIRRDLSALQSRFQQLETQVTRPSMEERKAELRRQAEVLGIIPPENEGNGISVDRDNGHEDQRS